jgi:hypothetical protein
MKALLIILSLYCFDNDRAKFTLDLNVKEYHDLNLVGCENKKLTIEVGYDGVNALGLDLHGYIKPGYKSYPLEEVTTKEIYQVRYTLHEEGILMFIVSKDKSYIISTRRCQ